MADGYRDENPERVPKPFRDASLPAEPAGSARDPAPRLSAVIACYKDAQAIPQMHQRLTDVFSALAVD